MKVTTDEKKSRAVVLLLQKKEELGRIPRKDDFDEPTRSRIKAYLGPWPRALETAGLKERKEVHRKNKKKRRSAGANSKCAEAQRKTERRGKLTGLKNKAIGD